MCAPPAIMPAERVQIFFDSSPAFSFVWNFRTRRRSVREVGFAMLESRCIRFTPETPRPLCTATVHPLQLQSLCIAFHCELTHEGSFALGFHRKSK